MAPLAPKTRVAFLNRSSPAENRMTSDRLTSSPPFWPPCGLMPLHFYEHPRRVRETWSRSEVGAKVSLKHFGPRPPRNLDQRGAKLKRCGQYATAYNPTTLLYLTFLKKTAADAVRINRQVHVSFSQKKISPRAQKSG